MDDQLLSCVELETAPNPDRAIVWLHGLGASGHDFPPLIPHMGLPPELAIRFVFPHAPNIPVTINGGMVMPAWYDILTMDLKRKIDGEGVRRSADAVEALLAREKDRGIPAERIILAGFSQGGAVALHTALRHGERLAGILALSTYLVLEETIEAERSPANQGVPVFYGHGRLDPMVQISRGQHARDQLIELGHPVTWREYSMGHEVCLEEAQDVGNWISQCFGDSDSL